MVHSVASVPRCHNTDLHVHTCKLRQLVFLAQITIESTGCLVHVRNALKSNTGGRQLVACSKWA